MSNFSLNLRRPIDKDVPKIEEIGKAYSFTLPDRFLHAAVVEKNDEVIAFGLIHIIIEAILICQGSDREKVELIRMLLKQAKEDTVYYKYNQIHVFVKDESFANILEKHFGFKDAVGRVLVLNIEDENGKE